MQDADDELRQHKERMAQYQEQIRQDQLRIDEDDAKLQEVARKVAASTEMDKNEDDDSMPSGTEVRSQAAGARKGLEAARDKLQDLHDQLEEQGNFVACEQINLLCGAIAGAAGNIDGMESLLVRPRPRRQRRQAEYYDMEETADATDADNDTTRGAPKGEEKPATTDSKLNPKTTSSTNRWDTKSRAPNQTTGCDDVRRMGGGGNPTPTPTATTTSTDAAVGSNDADAKGKGGGAEPNVIRYGGATSEEQERALLRKDAEQALEQAREKFKDAEQSQDTDKAALLYAHQTVLTKIGVPTTLEQREAYERWRGELGANLERVAAERLKEGGSC